MNLGKDATGALATDIETVSKAWEASSYYADAERWTHAFWDDQTKFRRCFDRLDLSTVVELACGQGRHTERVAPLAQQVIAIDIFSQNLAVCQERLSSRENVTCLLGDGHSFRPISDASVTAIFCYDAMVHFSPAMVASYLRDAQRILTPGGMVLLHHSNHDAPPERHYGQNPHARNRMTLEIFSDLAHQARLEIVESLPLPWGGIPDLDRLSLLQKPAG
jgi:ubiquinone/menaquinone biosynthesis C-methylase UbiE